MLRHIQEILAKIGRILDPQIHETINLKNHEVLLKEMMARADEAIKLIYEYNLAATSALINQAESHLRNIAYESWFNGGVTDKTYGRCYKEMFGLATSAKVLLEGEILTMLEENA